MKGLTKALWSSVVEGADSKRVVALVLLLAGAALCQKWGVTPPEWLGDTLKYALPAWLVGESYTSAKKNGAPPPPAA